MSQRENKYIGTSQSEDTSTPNARANYITSKQNIGLHHSMRAHFETENKQTIHPVPSTSVDSNPSTDVDFYASHSMNMEYLSEAVSENEDCMNVNSSEDEDNALEQSLPIRNWRDTTSLAGKTNCHGSLSSNRDDTGDDGEDTNVNVDSNEENNQNDLLSTDDDVTESHKVIMSVVYRKGRLGAAMYSFETSEIQLFDDIVDVSPEFKLLTTLFLQTRPTQIVTCSSQLSTFHQRLQRLAAGETPSISSAGTENGGFRINVIFVQNKEFEFRNCRRRVLQMKVASIPNDATDEERRNYIVSKVNIQAESVTCALGGLLYFLHKPLSRALLTDMNELILSISTIKMNMFREILFSHLQPSPETRWRRLKMGEQDLPKHVPKGKKYILRENLVWVDEETFLALQIFNPVLHPSSFKWSGQTASKEGLGILSLFNRCQSLLGAKHMRVLMTQPTNNLEILKMRQDVIEFCLKPENESTVEYMDNCIKEIRCVSKILTRMAHIQASITEWKSFFKTLHYSITIVELCKSIPDRPEFFNKIIDCGTEILFVIRDTTTRTIDFDESDSNSRIVIKEGIFEELDTLKEHHARMPLALANVAKDELDKLPDFVQSCSLVYIPEIGFLLAIPFWKPNVTDEDLLQLENLEYKFKAKTTAHYKNATCYELDNMLGDILVRILELETRIALKFVQYIQENIDPLRPLIRHIEELDCLIAMSKVARDYEFVRPTLVTDQIIDITDGRHPLQELCVNAFVPNNTESSFEKGLVTILTGPNACGKSVYLKQVALITYLAHIGSYVPAKHCTIGLVDHIHACLRTVESVTGYMSAFLIDLRQVSLSTYNSSPNSLIILDEFGKGTIETDGLAILASCIQHFLSRGDKCPHIFVSTHYHTLPERLPSSPLIKFQTLEHIVDDRGEIVYLYRLKEGSVNSSFAIQVAQATGLAPEITERSKQILEVLRNNDTVRPADSCQQKVHMTLRRKNFLERFKTMKFEDQRDLEIFVNELKTLRH